jgi:hypothetical protein
MQPTIPPREFDAACAAARVAHREPLFATAPERVAAWLLVEHPGPWPWPGLPPGLPPDVVRVWEAADRAGIRCQWIRPVRDRRISPVTVFAVGSRLGARWVERRTVDDLRDLADLDVATLATGRPPRFGNLCDQRVILVCTHGRRDVCCARLGRPAAVRLDRRLPGLVWETTHVGGDRFAANVVTLPDGSYHGGITAADTDELADAVMTGRAVPDRLRGRAGLPAPVQAADYYARARYGVRRLDGIVPLRHERVAADGTVRVQLQLDGGARCLVYVRPRKFAEVRATSCAGSGTTGAPGTFDLVGLERDEAVGSVGVTSTSLGATLLVERIHASQS